MTFIKLHHLPVWHAVIRFGLLQERSENQGRGGEDEYNGVGISLRNKTPYGQQQLPIPSKIDTNTR